VDAHSHPYRAGLESSARVAGRGQPAQRIGEGDEERVALRVHLYAVVALEHRPHHPTVLGERVRVVRRTQSMQKPRRTLDIGEQERDRPGGEALRAHASSVAPARAPMW
jgi:hypothetical protein